MGIRTQLDQKSIMTLFLNFFRCKWNLNPYLQSKEGHKFLLITAEPSASGGLQYHWVRNVWAIMSMQWGRSSIADRAKKNEWLFLIPESVQTISMWIISGYCACFTLAALQTTHSTQTNQDDARVCLFLSSFFHFFVFFLGKKKNECIITLASLLVSDSRIFSSLL